MTEKRLPPEDPILNREGLGHCDRCGNYFSRLHYWESVHNLHGDGTEEEGEGSFVCWNCFRKEMMKFKGDTEEDRIRMFNDCLWER